MKKIIGSLFFVLTMLIANLALAAPDIYDLPVSQEGRAALIRDYTMKHYGEDIQTITPRAVVVHWTAQDTWKSTYHWFYNANFYQQPNELNVCSQFLVDRDGTIFRLCPETQLAKHTIGYNHAAIGIENVGGLDNKVEDLTPEQLKANVELIRYLKAKYPTIDYVFGHYQQDAARASGLYREQVEGYYSIKVDPGKKFMTALQKELSDDGFVFYEP